MRLSQRVFITASGRAGCSLSHPADCNVYASDCGGPLLLIDSGVGLRSADLIDRLAADGANRATLQALLLTHGHLDYSGAADLHTALGLPVRAACETADAVESGNQETISLTEANRASMGREGH